MSTHTYSTRDIAVPGGDMRVGVWDPVSPASGAGPEDGVGSEDGAGTGGGLEAGTPTVLLIHGVTSSHLAWPLVAAQLPRHRILAPDLRGRGASRDLEGPAGMGAHARDMVAVLDAWGVESAIVVGHSMGGFVATVLAARAPERVHRLVLVDGGLPFPPPPPELSTEQVLEAILGPTLQRLTMRFASTEEYLDFWRAHPAFVDGWSPEVEDYFAYDLVPADGGGFHPATSRETTVEDMTDLTTGGALAEALVPLTDPARAGSVVFLTVGLGLQAEPPGLYPPAYVEELLATYPALAHTRHEEQDHYGIVMSEAGGRILGEVIRGLG